MNWRKAVKDWRVWAGAGVVGLLGVVALVRRQNAGGGDSSGGAYVNPAATSAAGGRPGDTTGTDIAGYLSSFFSSQLDAQKEFLASIKETIEGGDDGGQTTPPPPSGGGGGGTTPPPSTAPKYVTVAKYTSSNTPWNSTLSGIAKHEGTSVANLLNLNPFITNANLIHPGWKIRVS